MTRTRDPAARAATNWLIDILVFQAADKGRETMTSDAGAQPDWSIAAPAEASLAVINAMEYAARGDITGCCAVMVAASVHPRWLVIVAVDILAALGKRTADLWGDLRMQLHERAVTVAAPDELVRLSLLVVSMAEARARGDRAAVMELDSGSEFPAHDVSCVASQLAGQVAAHVWGDGLADRLQGARKLFGGVP